MTKQAIKVDVDVDEFKRGDVVEFDGPLPERVSDLVKGGYLRKVTASEAKDADRVRGADDEPDTTGGVAASAVTEPATVEPGPGATSKRATGATKKAR